MSIPNLLSGAIVYFTLIKYKFVTLRNCDFLRFLMIFRFYHRDTSELVSISMEVQALSSASPSGWTRNVAQRYITRIYWFVIYQRDVRYMTVYDVTVYSVLFVSQLGSGNSSDVLIRSEECEH